MSTTIKDIAEKANVSITTVSRVLNNKMGGISDQTRKRVQEIIEELEYRPNRIAQSMVTKKTDTIGLVIPDIRNPFFPELVRGVEDVTKTLNYSVFLCNTDGNKDREMEYLKLMEEKNVDGIIYTNSYSRTSQVFENIVKNRNIPTVLLDRELKNMHFGGVYIDNEEAGYLATKHLIDLSHTKIACITGPNHIRNSMDRLKGYKRALEEAGIEMDEDLVVSGDYQMAGGYQAAKKLLQIEGVTAIFTLNDLMAFGVYQYAGEAGMNLPDDLSIVGFDNLKYNQILNPKLTTIEQPTYKMGEIATEMLLTQIKEGEKSSKQTVYIEPKLIIRQSSSKLNTSFIE